MKISTITAALVAYFAAEGKGPHEPVTLDDFVTIAGYEDAGRNADGSEKDKGEKTANTSEPTTRPARKRSRSRSRARRTAAKRAATATA